MRKVILIGGCVLFSLVGFTQDSLNSDGWKVYNPKPDSAVVVNERTAEPAKVDKGRVEGADKALDFSQVDGKVQTFADSRIDAIINQQKSDPTPTFEGYRVQIYYDEDKAKVRAMKSRFMRAYPDVPAYDTYDPPNHKLRVGDFHTKMQALKFESEIQKHSPNTIVVKDDIKLPLLDIDKVVPIPDEEMEGAGTGTVENSGNGEGQN